MCRMVYQHSLNKMILGFPILAVYFSQCALEWGETFPWQRGEDVHSVFLVFYLSIPSPQKVEEANKESDMQ